MSLYLFKTLLKFCNNQTFVFPSQIFHCWRRLETCCSLWTYPKQPALRLTCNDEQEFLTTAVNIDKLNYRGPEGSCGSVRRVHLAIAKEKTERIHMYIHAYSFMTFHTLCLISKTQFENVEQSRKEQALLREFIFSSVGVNCLLCFSWLGKAANSS